MFRTLSLLYLEYNIISSSIIILKKVIPQTEDHEVLVTRVVHPLRYQVYRTIHRVESVEGYVTVLSVKREPGVIKITEEFLLIDSAVDKWVFCTAIVHGTPLFLRIDYTLTLLGLLDINHSRGVNSNRIYVF